MVTSVKAKQDWRIGQVVNIGFVKGLVVKEKVATPGDYLPDLYVLWAPASNRWYSFVPHNGLSRHESADLARTSWM